MEKRYRMHVGRREREARSGCENESPSALEAQELLLGEKRCRTRRRQECERRRERATDF